MGNTNSIQNETIYNPSFEKDDEFKDCVIVNEFKLQKNNGVMNLLKLEREETPIKNNKYQPIKCNNITDSVKGHISIDLQKPVMATYPNSENNGRYPVVYAQPIGGQKNIKIESTKPIDIQGGYQQTESDELQGGYQQTESEELQGEYRQIKSKKLHKRNNVLKNSIYIWGFPYLWKEQYILNDMNYYHKDDINIFYEMIYLHFAKKKKHTIRINNIWKKLPYLSKTKRIMWQKYHTNCIMKFMIYFTKHKIKLIKYKKYLGYLIIKFRKNKKLKLQRFGYFDILNFIYLSYSIKSNALNNIFRKTNGNMPFYVEEGDEYIKLYEVSKDIYIIVSKN